MVRTNKSIPFSNVGINVRKNKTGDTEDIKKYEWLKPGVFDNIIENFPDDIANKITREKKIRRMYFIKRIFYRIFFKRQDIKKLSVEGIKASMEFMKSKKYYVPKKNIGFNR